MENRAKNINGVLRKSSASKDKYLCCHCLKSGKGPNPCGISGHLILRTWHKYRFPSYTASKSKWIECLKAIGWIPEPKRDDEWNKAYTILMKSINKL